jgi:hypothetical protein
MSIVLKRFLRAKDGSAVNADHVVRIYTTPDGKLWADLTVGSDIELYSSAPTSGLSPTTLPAVSFVSIENG